MDHYLAIIQTILDRCENDNTSPDIHDMEIIKIHNLQSIMNGENIIPKITDKRGMSWNQPHRRYIEIDEEYALMTKQTFEGLREYSLTIPSGKYEGKMWKANRGGTWYLYWYDHDDNPEMIKIERREILLLN